ncbi:ABC transporter ATP-binding protein [Salinibacter altiplanensis]|uniref:ABC transporter ATP-binding protein n=1 Tax=Salinibacter altiplanensis TaxID=1803181 RepID=UPI000C9FCB8D|nr:ABC transporter ATP-binding protein [Salinibacter altiplanensis]
MLRLDALTKQYPSFALGPLDLEVGAEVLGLLGPSGSGKTTLLSLVAGTEPPTEGTVRLNGDDLSEHALETRGTARVFQESALFPHLTARENLNYAAVSSENIEELAARLEIDDVLDQPAHTLSGGEGRRVEVGRALASGPDVLLLDEPTEGLDTPVRRRLREQLRTCLTALDIPVLYVTHNQEEAASVADRIAVMKGREVKQVGSPTAVMRRPDSPFVAHFTGNPNVVPARLKRADSGPVLVWDEMTLPYSESVPSPDRDVWVCIRPEEVHVQAEATADTVEGQIVDERFEGHTYVLTIRLGGTPAASVRATVLPPTYRRLGLDPGRTVHVRLPPEAIHLIPRSPQR